MQKFILSMFLVLPSVAFGQTALTTAQIAKRVSPTVVVIQGKTDSGELLGSGFIVSKDGKIVTNLHVIRDLKTASVLLANGRTLDSVFVLATDERRDLAIIHISGFDPQKSNGDIFDQILDQIPQRSQVLELGDSDNVTVGNQSVGHPGATFLSGDRWGYRLLLISKTREISLVRRASDPQYPPVAQNVNWLDLTVADESISTQDRDGISSRCGALPGKGTVLIWILGKQVC